MLRGLNRNAMVDIPSGAIHEKKSGQVWERIGDYRDRNGQLRPKKLTIGKAFSDKQMYPNKAFQVRYPVEYAKASKTEVARYSKRIGLYAAMLSIDESTGVYKQLIDSYGIEYANVLVDFSMFSIVERSNAAELYEITMQDYLLFSGKAYSDAKMSRYFEHEITEDLNNVFRKNWIKQCIDTFRVAEVWVCIDGSNNDCDAEEQEEAEPGENKSHTNKNINGYMYVVSAKDGMPITYDSYRGNRVDCSEIYKMLDEMKGYGLIPKGVILDRNFANIRIIRELRARSIAFIIMLKTDSFAQKELFHNYAKEINMAFEHCVDDDGKMFGIVKQARIFSSYPDEAYVGLFYDSENGRARASYLIKQLKKVQKDALQQLEKGEEPKIPLKYSNYFDKRYDGKSKKWEVNIKLSEINNAIDKKGYSSIVTSENMTAAELHYLYHLRDYSEKRYACLKSQTGEDVDRTYYDNGHKAKMGVAFITQIFRFFISQVALKMDINTNVLIRNLNLLIMYQYTDEYYVYSETAQALEKTILSHFNLTEKNLQQIAEYETKQSKQPERNPVQSLHREKKTTSEVKKQKNNTDEQKKSEEAFPAKKHPGGRPKGSRNKSTLEREAIEEALRKEGKLPPKRPVGRPKGSKNKTHKLASNASQEPAKKHPGGRPKGSKNKSTLEREAREEALRKEGKLPPKRPVGRPKGSKNKKD